MTKCDFSQDNECAEEEVIFVNTVSAVVIVLVLPLLNTCYSRYLYFLCNIVVKH